MSMTAEELFAEEQRRRRAIAGVGATTGTTTGPRLLPPAKPILAEGGANKDKGGDDDGGFFQNLVASPIGWVSSQIANLPRFAMSAAKTGVNLNRLGVTGPKIVADYQEAANQGLSGLDQFYYATSGELPLVSQLSQGVITSGGNIGELATLGKLDTGEPGINYANAYRSGNLGATILDDLGNVVLVGRGVGAGNVISRAGGKVTAAGAPRLGRAISGTGRFVEEPIGTTARTTARLAQPVAGRYLGRPLLSERLGRVAQAGIDDNVGPFRQAIFEANDAVTTRALSRLGRVNQQIADLDRQFEANPTEGGRLAVERQKLMRQQSKWTRISGLVRNIRGFTRQRQIQEEQRRASFISEGLRLQERGPSVEFEGAPEGPLPEFAEKVANLILTGRMDVVIRELRAGVPFEQVLQSINPSGIGPDLARQGYAFTPDDLRKAVEYADGQLSDFDRLSVDAVVNFLRRFSDEFTAGQLSGEYRLGGPMPETYTRAFPIVEFLFSKDVRLPQVMFAALLDYMDARVAELVIANLDPETLKENNISATVEDPQGAFKQLAEVPKDSDLDGLAQILFEQFTPELMQRFPEIMRNPMIYPAPMRPAMMLEARLLRNAKAQDINTILTGLNALIEQYGDLLGKNTVASIVANLENIVGTPLENTPGAYTQVTRQLAGIRRAITERIAKLQERTGTLTTEQQTTVSNLIDAEQRLGAAEATLRTVAQAFDVLEPIPDEPMLRAEEAVGVARDKQAAVQKAIDEYRRSQAELQLQEDPRQTVIDDIDEAVRLTEQMDDPAFLEALIEEFDARQREVEAGRPDPALEDVTVDPRDPRVKAERQRRVAEAERRRLDTWAQLRDIMRVGKISWRQFNDPAFTRGEPFRQVLEKLLAEVDPALAKQALDYFARNHVGKKPTKREPVNRGVDGEDFVLRGNDEFGTVDESYRALAQSLVDVVRAINDERAAKKVTLAEVAQEMAGDVDTGFRVSERSLPVTARAIAYATNPNLLTADLRLRDRYASEMEAGLPYEGAPARLIPIPKKLEDEAARAERTVDRQQAKLDTLRNRSVAEQQKELKAQLKGVGKVVVEGEPPTATASLLDRPRAKIEREIEQYINKLENRRIKLEEVKARHAAEQALLDETGAIGEQASAVEQYLRRPAGAQLFADTVTPQYLPTGLPASARPGARVRTELSGEGAAPQTKAFSEQMRTSDEMPLTLRATVERINELLNVTGRNRIIDDIVLNPDFARRAGSFVTPEQLVEIYNEARAEVEAQNQRRTPQQIEAETEKLASVKLSRIIREAGYEPVSRVKVDPETGAHEAFGDLLQSVRDDQVDINTVVMRQGVRERITQQFKVKDATDMPEGFARYVEGIARATGQWKSVILPFRISWQTGDAVSNILNGWVRGDVPPQQLIDRMRDIDRILSAEGKRLETLTGSIGNPLIATLIAYGLQARGVRAEEVNRLRGVGDLRQAVPDYEFQRIFPRFREKSFRFNEYQNTLARVAVAMEKLERILAERGRSIDEVTLQNVRTDPVLRAAVEQVVRETNDALGAFSDMSPFEKNVVRNVYPFWSWIRYINKAAVQLAIDSPDRVLFTVALGALVADEEQTGLFPFLEGRVPLMGYYFDLSFMNPYQETILFSANPIKALLDQATNISPVISAPMQAASITGTYATGMRFPILPAPSRPSYLEGSRGASTRTFGDYVGELGYIGLQNFGGPFRSSLTLLPNEIPIIAPEGRLLGTDVAIGNVQRFPQGSQRTTGRYSVERLGPVASRVGALLGVIGIPRPLIEEDVALRQARLQTRADLEAQRRREEERRLSRIGQ
jgi:hypothetical protein